MNLDKLAALSKPAYTGAILGPNGQPLCLGEASQPIVPIRINHGRLLAHCPYCNGAELVDELRFWCRSCFNESVQYKSLPIEWTSDEDPEGVMATLLKRPIENRNWEPDETISQLRAENIAHGLEPSETE